LATGGNFSEALDNFTEAIKIIDSHVAAERDAESITVLITLLKERTALYGSVRNYLAALSDAQRVIGISKEALEYDQNPQHTIDLVTGMLLRAKARYLAGQVAEASKEFLVTVLAVESIVGGSEPDLYLPLIEVSDQCVSDCRVMASEYSDGRYEVLLRQALLRTGRTKQSVGLFMEAIGDFEPLISMGLEDLKENRFSWIFVEAWRRRGCALLSLEMLEETVGDFQGLEELLHALLEKGEDGDMVKHVQMERILVGVSWSVACAKMKDKEGAELHRQQAKRLYNSLELEPDLSKADELEAEVQRAMA
jgi:tetratricopeptide (TPR) repeat protein